MSLTPLSSTNPPIPVRHSLNLSHCQHPLRHYIHNLECLLPFVCLTETENCILIALRLYIICLHDFLLSIFYCNCVLYKLVNALFVCLVSVCVCMLQVAEMHGELIEFNERLYRSLMAKDHLIVQMRQELIDLRGPVSDWTDTHTHRCPFSSYFSVGFSFPPSLLSLSPCHFLGSPPSDFV